MDPNVVVVLEQMAEEVSMINANLNELMGLVGLCFSILFGLIVVGLSRSWNE